VEAKMYNEPEDISDLSKTSEGQGFNVVPSKKVGRDFLGESFIKSRQGGVL
jgi:hypothetical protein